MKYRGWWCSTVMSPPTPCMWWGWWCCLILYIITTTSASHSDTPYQVEDIQYECPNFLPKGEEGTRKYLFHNTTEVPLTLFTSQYSVGQQLFTRVAAIFIRQYLGYRNVTVVTTNLTDPKEIGLVMNSWRPTALNHTTAINTYEDFNWASASLMVWIPPFFDEDDLLDLGMDVNMSFLGLAGQYSWFMFKDLVKTRGLSEHWRVFSQPNSKEIRTFYRTNEEISDLKDLTICPITNDYYCIDKRCTEGVFIPNLCKGDTKCAVLFASYVNLSTSLFDMIEDMKLYVKVVWIGKNLNETFIRRNENFSKDRSVLFYHWYPDSISNQFDLISLSFPQCNIIKSPYFCKYEIHRFYKVFSKQLKFKAKILNDALTMMRIDSEQFRTLFQEYIKAPDPKDLDSIACSWLKNYKWMWETWCSKNKPSELVETFYLIGLFPLTTTHLNKYTGTGSVPAFDMAIEAVNNNNTILKDYKIDTYVTNSRCQRDTVMQEFVTHLQETSKNGDLNRIIGFVGPACTDTVEPLAGVAGGFKLSVISYGAEGAIFSTDKDNENYPYFFRTIPENKYFVSVYYEMFEELNWKRITSLNLDGQRYSEYVTHLEHFLKGKEKDYKLIAQRYTEEEIKDQRAESILKSIKDQRGKIIIADPYQSVARVFICKAYQMEMTGHNEYVWFLPHWYSKDWYYMTNNDTANPGPNCTTAQMKDALQGHMSLSYKYFGEDDAMMEEGINVREWRDKYEQTLKDESKDKENPIHTSDYAGFTYDAVWTYAFALDKLFNESISSTANLRSPETANKLKKHIKDTNFHGASGHINFQEGKSRVTEIIVWQFQDESYVEVGRFVPNISAATETNTHPGILTLYKNKFHFGKNGNTIPTDGREVCSVEWFREPLEIKDCVNAIIILCAIAFGALSLLLILCFFGFKRRYEKKLEDLQELWKDNSIYKKFYGWEIPREKVVINRKLGEGEFGMVYGGECLRDNHGWAAVAVKTLKIGALLTEKLDFLTEAENMKNFKHENIVSLIGVCTETEPIYTIMEFMLYGDLKTYLLARRNIATDQCRDDNDEVSNFKLTQMAIDVAKALEYIAEKKYVHRDIASRNCLLNAQRTVKLADFGLTRCMVQNNYYRLSRRGMVPVRWMSPEAIVNHLFTTASDIWSYGVLVYEIITFGAFPFKGMTNDQVMNHVKGGKTLLIPPLIQPELEELLTKCWEYDAENRPVATDILKFFEKHPRIISPNIDGPLSAVEPEEQTTVEVKIPEKNRKLSLAINNRHPQMASNRKRSMSGNMTVNASPVATSLSEDTIMHTNIEALNLNHVNLDEHSEAFEGPLLPPQYVSSKFLRCTEKERESLMCKQSGDYCTTEVKELWTSMTPV